MSGGVIGPVVAGVLLERELAVAYIGAMLGSLALVAWLLLRLERIISPEVNGVAPSEAPRASIDATTP